MESEQIGEHMNRRGHKQGDRNTREEIEWMLIIKGIETERGREVDKNFCVRGKKRSRVESKKEGFKEIRTEDRKSPNYLSV